MDNLLKKLFVRHEIGKNCNELKRFNVDHSIFSVNTEVVTYGFLSEAVPIVSTGFSQDSIVWHLLTNSKKYCCFVHLVHDDVSLAQAFPDFLVNLKDSEAIKDLGPDVTTFQMDGFKLKCAGPIGIHAHYQGKHGLIAFLDKFNIEQ